MVKRQRHIGVLEGNVEHHAHFTVGQPAHLEHAGVDGGLFGVALTKGTLQPL